MCVRISFPFKMEMIPSFSTLSVFMKYLKDTNMFKLVHDYERDPTIHMKWFEFTLTHRPDISRKIIDRMEMAGDDWILASIDAAATAARHRILKEQLHRFMKMKIVSYHIDETLIAKAIETVMKWADDVRFAKPCIAKKLLNMFTYFLTRCPSLKKKDIVNKLFNSVVITRCISTIAEWLARKFIFNGDACLRQWLRKKKSCPAIAAALYETSVAKSLFQRDKFRATVRIAMFFKYHLSKEKLHSARQKVTIDTCMVCWGNKLLFPLHDDVRHNACMQCVKRMRKNNMHSCPMCRAYITM